LIGIYSVQANAVLTMATAAYVSWGNDLLLYRNAAADLRLGAVVADTAGVAQTLRSPDGGTATGVGKAGANFTIYSGSGSPAAVGSGLNGGASGALRLGVGLPGAGDGAGTSGAYTSVEFGYNAAGTWAQLASIGTDSVFAPATTGTGSLGYSFRRWSAAYLGGNTVTASMPMLDMAQTWNAAGTAFVGATITITDTASAAGSLPFQILGGAAGTTNLLAVSNAGAVQIAASFVAGAAAVFTWAGRGVMASASDGVIALQNNAQTDFSRLQLGGTGPAFPSIKRVSAGLAARLADDSADANLSCAALTVSGGGGTATIAANGASSLTTPSIVTSAGGVVMADEHRLSSDANTTRGSFKVTKVTKAYNATLFNAAATTDSEVIYAQPANSILVAAYMVLDTQFAAASMTDLDITIGDGGGATGILNAAMNLTSDAATTKYATKGSYFDATAGTLLKEASTNWTAYVTATGANLDTLSAGQVSFYFVTLEW
jgi:hypothetical protein